MSPSVVERSQVTATDYLVSGVPFGDYLEAPGRTLRIRDGVEVWIGPRQATIVSADAGGVHVRLPEGLDIGTHGLVVIGASRHQRPAALRVVDGTSADGDVDASASDSASADISDAAPASDVAMDGARSDSAGEDARDATGCMVECTLPNAMSSCTRGMCVVDACVEGFADCDERADNGCESDVQQPGSCGRCGVVCAPSEMCVAGVCSPTTSRVRLANGTKHTCAVVNGSVYCWGDNSDGQLGDGTTTDSSRAVDTGLRGTVDIAAGDKYSCALLSDGTVRCWGSNSGEVFGDREPSRSLVPMEIEGLTNATAISAGRQHVCVTLGAGGVVCWGHNNRGQLGRGSIGGHHPVGPVTGLPPARSIACGREHTCAIAGGSVFCWGEGDNGALGNGETSNAGTPVDIAWSAAHVSLGDRFSCSIAATGEVSCWGRNSEGQLAHGRTGDSTTPMAVRAFAGAEDLSAGDAFGCSVLTSGQVWCWGRDAHGQTGANAVDSGPVAVPGITDALHISAGGEHACAVRTDDSIVCWGRNDKGQLGNETNDDSDAPVGVRGLP